MRSPLADPAPDSAWLAHLELAHGFVHAAARVIEEQDEPSSYLAPAARRLEGGIVAMYDAFDGRADRVSSLGVAHARLLDAAIFMARAGLPTALAALEEACGELIAAEERFPRVPLAGRSAASLQAGLVLPVLHVVERASLSPLFRAPPVREIEPDLETLALPDPKTFAELAQVAEALRRHAKALRRAPASPKPRRLALPPPLPEDVPEGFAFVPPKPIHDDDFRRRWARECFEEIGMLGVQRLPLLDDDWRACQALEKRMIGALDALAALGPVALAHVERLALDAPAADAMRIFAAAMIGGCLEGRDALGGAERVLHRFGPGDPMVASAFASAMRLAPNPFVPSVLRALLIAPERGCRAIAVEVLAHRGWLTSAELSALSDEEDPAILALALPALASARHPDFQRLLVRGLGHPEARVQAAALDAMALAAHAEAAVAARAAVSGPLGEGALARLALVAGEDDARWLLERMKASLSPASIEAVGWAGLVAAVPALLDLLETSEKDDAKLAAGAALERLLGAGLKDTIEVLPEALEEVDVLDPDPDRAVKPRAVRSLAELTGDRRDSPPAGSSDSVEVPSTKPARWRAYWNEHHARYDPKLRLRRGQGYSPSVSLYELDGLSLAPEDRRRLHRELAARTGKITSFDPHDLVATQEQSLKAWETLVRGTSENSGAWTRPLR